MAHNLALVLTFALFYAGARVHQWWKANHSPTGDPNHSGRVKPQVGGRLTPDDPTLGGADGEGKTISRSKTAVDAWLASQSATRGTNELIRESVRKFKISASTVKRKLRRLREDSPQ